MHFGATLRFLRLDAGLSLRELARQIGVSSAYLSRVENGHDPAPTVDRLAAISDALGLPRSVLLELAGQAGPAVTGYLNRVPGAHALVLELARRNLGPAQIARVRAFLDTEFPAARATPTVRLSGFLAESRILLGLACADPEDLVTTAVARLPPLESISSPELVRRLLAREESNPSYLGGGFLAPHVALPGAETWVVLSILARPLAAPTPDGEPLRFCVLVVSGLKGPAHLELLSRVARLASTKIAADLERARSAAQVLRLLEDLESTW